jgi:hypothetical protein
MNTPVQTQTPLASKSDGDEAMCKVCTLANVLRTSLAAIEANLTVATATSRTSRPLTEKEKYLRPLNEREKERLARDREALVSGFENSRFLRGKLLFEYRAAYRGSKLWMQALKAIADSEGVVINTIRNYIRDYEAAMHLPDSVRSALSDQGIDPAKKKNRIVVERVTNRLSSEPKQPNQEQARQIVIEETMKIPVAPDLSDVSEELDADEKLRHLIRKGIRRGLVNVPIAKRLKVLLAAIEEEIYMVWGQKEPVTITLRPHWTPITFDGRKLKSDERTKGVAA